MRGRKIQVGAISVTLYARHKRACPVNRPWFGQSREMLVLIGAEEGAGPPLMRTVRSGIRDSLPA